MIPNIAPAVRNILPEFGGTTINPGLGGPVQLSTGLPIAPQVSELGGIRGQGNVEQLAVGLTQVVSQLISMMSTMSGSNTPGGVASDAQFSVEDSGATNALDTAADIGSQSQMMELLLMLIEAITGERPSGITSLPQGQAALAGNGIQGLAGLNAPQRSLDDGEAINRGGNQELQQSLDAIEQDPVGSTLLAQARANGVTIRVGDTGGENILGYFSPSRNEIVVGDASNIKTIVHELGHAATPGDGNSQEEEGIVEAIGRDVESRIRTGRSLSDGELQSIATNKRRLYRDLQTNNGIKDSLAALGIGVGIT